MLNSDLLVRVSGIIESPLARAALLLAVRVELRIPQNSQRPTGQEDTPTHTHWAAHRMYMYLHMYKHLINTLARYFSVIYIYMTNSETRNTEQKMIGLGYKVNLHLYNALHSKQVLSHCVLHVELAEINIYTCVCMMAWHLNRCMYMYYTSML